ncbi:MAG: hypothetical protein AAF919_13325 [Pseudomonadota bacterium]
MRAFTLFPPLAVLVLAACEPPIPQESLRGAAFETPAQYVARREAELTGQQGPQPTTTTAAPTAIGTAAQSEADRLASDTRAALGLPSGGAAPVADLDRDNPELSREQDFAAVSAERGIQDDAERLRAARAQFEVVQPVEVERPDDNLVNIVAYALNQAQPVGTDAYGRGLFASERRAQSACAGYRDDNAAQEAFLAAGGPQRDALGVDPDGDGNACGWDPSVYRSLVRSQ